MPGGQAVIKDDKEIDACKTEKHAKEWEIIEKYNNSCWMPDQKERQADAEILHKWLFMPSVDLDCLETDFHPVRDAEFIRDKKKEFEVKYKEEKAALRRITDIFVARMGSKVRYHKFVVNKKRVVDITSLGERIAIHFQYTEKSAESYDIETVFKRRMSASYSILFYGVGFSDLFDYVRMFEHSW